MVGVRVTLCVAHSELLRVASGLPVSVADGESLRVAIELSVVVGVTLSVSLGELLRVGIEPMQMDEHKKETEGSA
jgi:hypothetical protein